MNQNWFTCKNVFGQQPKRFATTQKVKILKKVLG